MTPTRRPEVPGLLTAADLERTVETIAEWQLPSGMVPWFPGGHADPWNHTEALMALMLTGHRAEAERGFDWLRPTSSGPTGPGTSTTSPTGVEQDKLDANCIAYVAAGVWFHWLTYRRPGLRSRTMWPMERDATDFVLGAAAAAGRDHLGASRRRHPVHLRPADRVVVDLPQPALLDRHRRGARPRAAELGALGRALARVIRTTPTPSPRSTAGRWTGTTRCCAGSSAARRPRAPRRTAATPSCWTGAGCAACRDRPWITAAETCECAIAHLSVGERGPGDRAVLLGAAAPHRRRPLLDRHRAARRGPLPRRRAVDLHRRRGDPRRRRPQRAPHRPCSPTTSCCRPCSTSRSSSPSSTERRGQMPGPTRARTRRDPTASTSANAPEPRARRYSS
jgi:hypothetical protein